MSPARWRSSADLMRHMASGYSGVDRSILDHAVNDSELTADPPTIATLVSNTTAFGLCESNLAPLTAHDVLIAIAPDKLIESGYVLGMCRSSKGRHTVGQPRIVTNQLMPIELDLGVTSANSAPKLSA